MPYDQTNSAHFDRKIEFEDLNSIYAPSQGCEPTSTHDLSPITTHKEFAKEQLKNSLAQAAFWLGVARSWAQEEEAIATDQFFVDLSDAEHYTEIALNHVGEEK